MYETYTYSGVTFSFLPFSGEAPLDIQEKTGKTNFNFKLKFLWNEQHDESMKEAVRTKNHLPISFIFLTFSLTNSLSLES